MNIYMHIYFSFSLSKCFSLSIKDYKSYQSFIRDWTNALLINTLFSLSFSLSLFFLFFLSLSLSVSYIYTYTTDRKQTSHLHIIKSVASLILLLLSFSASLSFFLYLFRNCLSPSVYLYKLSVHIAAIDCCIKTQSVLMPFSLSIFLASLFDSFPVSLLNNSY